MLRLKTASLVLTFAGVGCALAPPPATLRIEGRLDGPAAGTLAAHSEWVVELRDDASGRVLAEQRGAVSATQPPIAFVLSVDAVRVDGSRPHSVRGAVRGQGGVSWLSEPRSAALDTPRIDLGSLRLQPYRPPGAFASTLDCGGRRLTIGHVGDQLRLTDGAQQQDLVAVPGSRPPRYERPGEAATFVELDDAGATVSLQGQQLPRCAATPVP